MAHTLVFSYGGSVFNVNSGSNRLLKYVPNTPDISTIDTNSIRVNGGERTMVTRRNVNDTITFMASASSQTELQSAKHYLQRIIGNAELRQVVHTTCPAYIYYAPDGTSGSYRSEILSGKVEISDESLDWRWAKAKTVLFDVNFTRRFYWEGDEVTPQIANNYDGPATCITIRNSEDDISNTMSVRIDSGCVTGEMPTPAVVRITSTVGSPITPTRWIIGHYVRADEALINWTLEAEDTSLSRLGGASQASLSSGSYGFSTAIRNSFPAACTVACPILGWTLAGASLLQRSFGGHYSIYAHIPELSPSSISRFDENIYGQFKLRIPGTSSVIFEGPEVSLSNSTCNVGIDVDHLQNFGVFRFPPNLVTQQNITNLDLVFYVRSPVSGCIAIDFMTFFMTDFSYREVYWSSTKTWGSTHRVILDEINEQYYVSNSDANETSKTPNISVHGKPIVLYPGLQQYLFFQLSEGTQYCANRPQTIRVTYRPRRYTI